MIQPPGTSFYVLLPGTPTGLKYRVPSAHSEITAAKGDVGAFDEEGLLTLKDRSKDMIISGGSNIYPREIEDVLNLHAGVAECSVVGRDRKSVV